MKKLLLIPLFIFAISTILNAQINSESEQTTIEPQSANSPAGSHKFFVGYNRSWVSNVEYLGITSKSGFQIGLSTQSPLGDYLATEYGARYITKGFKYGFNTYYNYGDEFIGSYHYLDPFIKLKVANLEIPLEPYIGASTAFLLWTTEKVKNGYNFRSDSDIAFDELELNMLFGADYTIQNKYVLGIEYSLGLVRIVITPKLLIS